MKLAVRICREQSEKLDDCFDLAAIQPGPSSVTIFLRPAQVNDHRFVNVEVAIQLRQHEGGHEEAISESIRKIQG